MTDMVYTVARSRHIDLKDNKRMLVFPKDAPGHNPHPDFWEILFNVRVTYKREFLAELAKSKLLNCLEHKYVAGKIT